jgi:hypothetical protein
VLLGGAHVAVHETARELFEERRVYDATVGYDLATLNPDRRRPDAGFRYAEAAGDPGVPDARDLPPPEPLRRTLERLADLGPAAVLVRLNDRAPRHLFPRLEDRGFEHETVAVGEAGATADYALGNVATNSSSPRRSTA